MTTLYKITIMTMAADGNQISQTFETEEQRDAMMTALQSQIEAKQAYIGVKPDFDKSRFGKATIIIPTDKIAFIESIDILTAA